MHDRWNHWPISIFSSAMCSVSGRTLVSSWLTELDEGVPMSKMPVYFLSHGGGPWPYVDDMRPLFARTERAFEALPAGLPMKPTAVLVITGHWEEEAFTVSTAEHPPMVYDYGGFPAHTYHIQYPAPGSPM